MAQGSAGRKISARTRFTNPSSLKRVGFEPCVRVALPSASLRSGVTTLARWHVHGTAQIRRDQIFGEK